jgi:tetratricopeptide (TPR) repeat protein
MIRRSTLAAVLAGGLMLGGAALSAPAAAKDKKEETKSAATNSKAFAEAFEPLQKVVYGTPPDYATAKGLVPAATAAVQTPHDKFVMGNLLVALGDKTNDVGLEKQGVRLILDSGEADASKVGLFHFYLGKWALDDKDFATARTELQAAAAAGYKEVDPEALIAETYFQGNQPAEGLTYLTNLIAKRKAAGVAIPDAWLGRGLAVAYNAKLAPQGNQYAEMLLANNASPENWLKAFTAVATLNPLDGQSELDMLRLMRLTGALKERFQYTEYVSDTSKFALANEALDVLKEGVDMGIFTTSDPFYVEAHTVAMKTADSDRKETPGIVPEARAAKDGKVAYGAGNAFYSFGDYANAEAMFKLAADKGLPEKDLALTRMGMAQIQQGKLAEGQATLAQVSGPRAPVARMWMAYANSKSAGA